MNRPDIPKIKALNDEVLSVMKTLMPGGDHVLAESVNVLIGWIEHLENRAKALDIVHAASCRHLEALGICDDADGDCDEPHCDDVDCTYCELDRVASAVEENVEHSGGGQS